MLLQFFGVRCTPKLKCSFSLPTAVPNWSQVGPKLVPEWCQIGPKLVPNGPRLVRRLFQIVPNLVHNCAERWSPPVRARSARSERTFTDSPDSQTLSSVPFQLYKLSCASRSCCYSFWYWVCSSSRMHTSARRSPPKRSKHGP